MRVPTAQQLRDAGPVRTVPSGEQGAKRAVQQKGALEKQVQHLTPIAQLATNQALLTLINEGKSKAMTNLVQTKDLPGEGAYLQAEVKVWATIEATLVAAVRNLRECQDRLTKCP